MSKEVLNYFLSLNMADYSNVTVNTFVDNIIGGLISENIGMIEDVDLPSTGYIHDHYINEKSKYDQRVADEQNRLNTAVRGVTNTLPDNVDTYLDSLANLPRYQLLNVFEELTNVALTTQADIDKSNAISNYIFRELYNVN